MAGLTNKYWLRISPLESGSGMNIPFVIHLGDLGRPDVACTDSWLEKTRLFWENELIKPVFYTPGDNDWTDCDREKLVVRSKELERLDAVRRILFSQPKPLGSVWQYEEQASLPENQTWWHKASVLLLNIL